MTRVSLSKHAYMWNSDGGRREHANGYRVGSLPPGYEALINNAGGPDRNDWNCLLIMNGVSSERVGHFETADGALADLESNLTFTVH